MALARAVMIVLTAVFWRWLKIATFDEGFAEALGIPAAAVGFGLVIASALAAVAAFEAVGSIIVIAMFICPPAAARLMTSRPRAAGAVVRRSSPRFGHSGLRACGVRTDCGWARRIRSAPRE
jgi:ABC-type Mn2+/Zn2+ transport system permease subunit